VCENGFNKDRNRFVQYYGAEQVDASLLFIPLVGFLPASDTWMQGTVATIERDLMRDGFIERYPTQPEVDGLSPGEGVLLACIFWCVDNLILQGRREEAEKVFERLLGLSNDVGLLAEEYAPEGDRLLGNFPQAFLHVALINTAHNFERSEGEHARLRGGRC